MGGGSGHEHFLVILNLRLKIFWTFFFNQVLWILNLSGEGESRQQLFLVMPNLRSKFFGNFFHY